MAKKWIQGAIKHPGALHKQLGVPQGEKIPAKKMSAARAGKYGPTAEKRAHLAKTLGSFETGGTVPKTGPYTLHEGETVIPAPEDHVPGKGRNMDGNNCCVLGTGGSESDHAHVKKMTPMDTKKMEYANDPMYRTKAESDLDSKREASTRNLRNSGDVRPLGGNK